MRSRFDRFSWLPVAVLFALALTLPTLATAQTRGNPICAGEDVFFNPGNGENIVVPSGFEVSVFKSETSKPEGTTIFSPLPGLKKTSSPAQIGFPRVWAVASVGRVSTSANKTATGNQLNRSNLLRMSTPFSALSSVVVNGISICSLQGELRSARSSHPREHHLGNIMWEEFQNGGRIDSTAARV